VPEETQTSSGRVAFIVAGLVIALVGGFGLGRLTSGDSARPTAAVAAPTPSATADHSHAAGTGPHTH
jgi:hypothetical protein